MTNVAKTILEQLGGNRFYAMTGAHSAVYGQNFLMFTLPKPSKWNKFRIVLTPSDTYTVEFMKVARWGTVEDCVTLEDVYCDMLQTVFTEFTGLATKL